MPKQRFYLTVRREISQGGSMSIDLEVPQDVYDRDDDQELFDFADAEISRMQTEKRFPFHLVEWNEPDDIDADGEPLIDSIEVGDGVP